MSGAKDSYLSDPFYGGNGGFELVVATTQKSINATMKQYLKDLKGRSIYMIQLKVIPEDDDSGDIKPAVTEMVTFEELLRRSGGVDPWKIPKKPKKDDKDVRKLAEIGFNVGIKITQGLPGNYTADSLTSMPNIIEMSGGASAVDYRMLCQNIEIIESEFTVRGPTWRSVAQNDAPNRSWVLNSKVNLTMGKESDWAKLPQEMRDKIKNLRPEMFDIQQLLFDLDNAGLSTVPNFEEIGVKKESDAAGLLTRFFVNSYFGDQKKAGQPVLGYTVKQKTGDPTWKPIDLNFNVNLVNDGGDGGNRTLNYLCALFKPLPDPVQFKWDWVSAEESKNTHGVLAINHLTFATFMRDHLIAEARKICFVPKVRVTNGTGLSDWDATYYDAWPDKDAWVNFNVTHPDHSSGSRITEFSYNNSDFDEAGLGGSTGSLKMIIDFSCKSWASGETINVETEIKVTLNLRHLQSWIRADIIHKKWDDYYKLAVSADGKMVFEKLEGRSTYQDTGATDTNDFLNFFTGANALYNNLRSSVINNVTLKDPGINNLDNFVFPGGKTFAFSNFRFSDHGDLLCSLIYAKPTY